MKTFADWDSEELELTFGLNRIYTPFEPLLEIINAEQNIDLETQKTLLKLKEKLNFHAEFWNEDEIKFFFISPLISIIDFTSLEYNGFTQRDMSSTLLDVNNNEVELKGRVEFVVAIGKQTPRQPFFYLHEYKPEKNRNNDPLGQVLAGMLVAQNENHDEFPIYGCYVNGRMWFFVALKGKEYSVSKSYDATNENIFGIYKNLLTTKKNIEHLVKKINSTKK